MADGTTFVARRARRRKPFIALTLIMGLLAGIVGMNIAGAATTVSPTQPGLGVGGVDLVRNDDVTFAVDVVGATFTRANATANFTRPAAVTAGGASGCRGDDPATTNLSPRTTITVTDPDGAVVATYVSPAINASLLGGLAGYPVLDPQPAPSATNYRGAPVLSNGTVARDWKVPFSLAGRTPGVYTVATSTQNMVRTGTVCSIGTPVAGATAGTYGNAATTGTVDEIDQFEYRPWQYRFKDVLGNGTVQFNLSPVQESAQTVGAANGAVVEGGITPYALPSGSTFTVPTDPAACALNVNACFPEATSCNPSAGCQPRFVVINRNSPAEQLTGVFDLESKAFYANGRVGKTGRTLLSLGPDNDAVYKGVLSQLSAQATASGIDLGTILNTKVRVRTGRAGVGNETLLSLAEGLQVDPSTGAGGVQIVSATSAQAGLVIYIGAGTHEPIGGIGGTCPAGGSNADGLDTYDPPAGFPGLRASTVPVKLPPLPAIALPAIDGVPTSVTSLPVGDIFHVETTPGTAGTLITAIGADTDEGAPSGNPFWTAPLEIHTSAPARWEFLGTGTWVNSYTNLLVTCLNVSAVIGVGIGVTNNPLKPLGIGLAEAVRLTTPLLKPFTQPLLAIINDAVGTTLADPTVAALLEQVLAAASGG